MVLVKNIKNILEPQLAVQHNGHLSILFQYIPSLVTHFARIKPAFVLKAAKYFKSI